MMLRISPEDTFCDFCSSREPRWEFRCRDFRIDALTASESGWLACHECAAFVQRHDWTGLAQRLCADGGIVDNVRLSLRLIGEESTRRGLVTLWQEFDRHRVGNPIEWKL